MSLSVVIPSRNAANLLPCVNAVREHEPGARIIVVDDGLPFTVRYGGGLPVEFVQGIKPFIFSRNVNLGIRAAESDDVLVTNDDALLQTPNGFYLLQKAAAEHREFGVIAATTNVTGNRNQLPKGIGLREDPRAVCFVAVLVPRRTIEAVGLLDEEFTAYGFEDDSYCLRVRRAGLKIGIHDDVFVDHSRLTSTFRGDPTAPGKLAEGREIFVHKWGSYPL